MQNFEQNKNNNNKKLETLRYAFNISLFCGAFFIDGQYKFQHMIFYLA